MCTFFFKSTVKYTKGYVKITQKHRPSHNVGNACECRPILDCILDTLLTQLNQILPLEQFYLNEGDCVVYIAKKTSELQSIAGVQKQCLLIYTLQIFLMLKQ